MKFGSLFSGIGGIDLGFERAGMKCAWQVEIDEFCQKILAKHWPDVPKYGDIRDVGKTNLETVDLIVGGFPCQDVSLAGVRRGLSGKRSTLWSEYYRIICEIRPRWAKIGSSLAWTIAKYHLQNGGIRDNDLIIDPCLSETMMGFPVGWTDLSPAETP